VVTAPQDPYLSPDGRWRWDGAQWVPAAPSWYPPAPPRSAHDGKAIASFVVSLVGMCGINSVVAVVLGHQSRRDARREGREPSGFATAGLVIGYLGLAVTVALIGLFAALYATGSLEPTDEGTARVEAAGPAAVALHDAEVAQEAYRTSHGVYAGSTSALSEVGYSDPDGVTVSVLWVYGESYCLRGEASGSTLYLATSDGSDAVATPDPCG
jgi:hypothetical protein